MKPGGMNNDKYKDAPKSPGRPPTDPATHQKRRQVTLDDETVEELKNLSPEENLSEGIRLAAGFARDNEHLFYDWACSQPDAVWQDMSHTGE